MLRVMNAHALVLCEVGETGIPGLNGYVLTARWVDARNWPRLREAFFGKAPWVVRKLIAPTVRRRILRDRRRAQRMLPERRYPMTAP